MDIKALAHILRASKALTEEVEFVLVGSQAILVQFPEAPEELLFSDEIDIWPRNRPELAEIIEGSLGDGSFFKQTFGYHADGVGPETAKLPGKWQERAVRLSGHPLLEGAVAICPELHDLAVSKLVAYREKDLDWVDTCIRHGLVQPATLAERLAELRTDAIVPGEVLNTVSAWIGARNENDRDAEPR